jgi:hypothetical protein
MRGSLVRIGRIAFIWVLVVTGLARAVAQDGVMARFEADTLAPLAGQPVTLMLVVQVPAGTVVNWPDFPEDWPPFMVRTVGEKQVVSSSAGQTIRQTLTVILWRPGDYETPDFMLDYQLPGETVPHRIAAEKVFFSVPSVLDPDDLTLRPLKAPIALPYITPALVIGVTVGLFVAAVMGWRWRHRPVRKLRRAVVASDLHPAAQAALTQIRQAAETHQPAADTYRRMADVLRGYVGRRFGVPAPELTTGELRAALETHPEVALLRQRELQHLLEQADLVKFAAQQPRSDATQRMLGVAYEWVERVDRAAATVEKQP